jgi:serine protease inhibitor
MKRSAPVAAAVAAAVLCAGCAAGAVPAPAPRQAGGTIRGVAAIEPAASPVPFATADLALGLSLLTASCTSDPDGNIVLSPSSLATGLGMAYLGAQGASARAMRSVLHLPAVSRAGLESGLQARSRALAGLNSPGVTVADSDEVWTDPGPQPLRGYLNAVATGYSAGVGLVPLRTNPAGAAAKIDAAIAAVTRGHIPHLLTASDLRNMIFVLTDALYLNARWATPFQRSAENSAAFTTASGSRVTARYLNGDGYRAAKASGWTAVRLPYRGGSLAMTALLPPAGAVGGASGCQVPTTDVVGSLARELGHNAGGAAITLPRVSLHSDESLKPILTQLGMGPAFAPDGDFDAMSPQTDGIGDVVHAATLSVDSAGTVASAATAVTMEGTAAELPVTFDRPYLMLITDVHTGEPLFLARVANPDQP